MLVHESPSRDNREISSFSSSAFATAVGESAPGGTPDTDQESGTAPSFIPPAFASATSPGQVLWTVPEVMAVVRVKSRTSLYLLEKNAGFPRRIHIGKNVCFVSAEVMGWLEGRIKARDTQPAPAVSDTNPVSDTSDQPVVKRGRGRPRKVVVTARGGCC